MAYNYNVNQPLNLKMPVDVTAAGYIAQEGDTPTGQKILYFANWKSNLLTNNPGTLIENFSQDFIGDVLGAGYDMLTSKITVDYVAEET